MDIKLANTLFDDGTFMMLFNAGFITYKVFLYREIYLYVDMKIKTEKLNKRKAVILAADFYKVNIRTIFRALNSFSKP